MKQGTEFASARPARNKSKYIKKKNQTTILSSKSQICRMGGIGDVFILGWQISRAGSFAYLSCLKFFFVDN